MIVKPDGSIELKIHKNFKNSEEVAVFFFSKLGELESLDEEFETIFFRRHPRSHLPALRKNSRGKKTSSRLSRIVRSPKKEISVRDFTRFSSAIDRTGETR
jgi:hypothetical protein